MTQITYEYEERALLDEADFLRIKNKVMLNLKLNKLLLVLCNTKVLKIYNQKYKSSKQFEL